MLFIKEITHKCMLRNKLHAWFKKKSRNNNTIIDDNCIKLRNNPIYVKKTV